MFFFSCSFGVNPAVLIFLSFNILASWVIDAFLLCMARTDSIWSSGWKVVCFISPRNNLLTKVFLYQALGNTKISYKKNSWNQNIITIWKKNLIGFFSWNLSIIWIITVNLRISYLNEAEPMFMIVENLTQAFPRLLCLDWSSLDRSRTGPS